MQDTFARERTRPKGNRSAASPCARDDRVSCIQMTLMTFFWALNNGRSLALGLPTQTEMPYVR